jgi:hypothetical protein
MTISFNNKLISKIEADFYRNGIWCADCYFANDPIVNTKSQLIIDDIKWTGTVINSNMIGPGIYKARIVAGNGKLTSVTTAQNLPESSFSNVLNKLIEGKEDIGTIPSNISSYKLKQWEVIKDVPRSLQISKLLNRFENYVWRFSNDGLFIITDDSSSGNTILPKKASYIDSSFEGNKVYKVANLDVFPKLGSTMKDGCKIEQINLIADHKNITLTIMKTSLVKAFDLLTARKQNESFEKCYSVKVHSVNSDNTINVIADDNIIKGNGIKKIPLYTPYGFTINESAIKTNTMCIVQYFNGDPSKPIVIGFEKISNHSGTDVYATIGNENNAQLVALANIVNENFQKIKDYINNSLVLQTPVGPSAPGDAAAASLILADVSAKRLKVE